MGNKIRVSISLLESRQISQLEGLSILHREGLLLKGNERKRAQGSMADIPQVSSQELLTQDLTVLCVSIEPPRSVREI